MSELSPTMRSALASLYRGRRMLFRPVEVPGGHATIRALTKRGLMEPNGQYLQLTDQGVERARELVRA